MVFQSYALFPNMTVEGNIAFGLKMKKLASDEIQREVTKVIELVDLKGKEKHYPHQLSGGQRQRVALAERSWLNLVFFYLMSRFRHWMQRSVSIFANRSAIYKKR